MAPVSGASIEVLLNIWNCNFERASMRITWETFGMKRLLLGTLALVTPATAATAADLYTKARPAPPPVAPPLLFSWTGFYVGGNIGGGWENFNITDTRTGLSFGSNTRSAFIGGGQVGFNYQVNPFLVLGVEGFFDGIASNKNTGTGVVIPGIGLVTASEQPDWVSTAAGRIGFTGPGFDHWLLYAKGGGGWVQTNATVNAPFATFSESRSAGGWMAGGGIEWSFAPSWTARIDYQFIGLENTTIAPRFLVDTLTTRNADVQTLTVGVNYLFNWGTVAPVASRF
jgi:outer membrane immunogenic protein